MRACLREENGREEGASTRRLTPSSPVRFALPASSLRLATVMFSVDFCRFSGVMCGVMKMTCCSVCVMCGCFVVSRFVVFCSFLVVPGRVFVVFGSFVVMLRSFLDHFSS
jgi:hypothetical protein